MSRPAPALATLSTPPPRIHERTQIIKPVSGDQSGRHQFPQPLFDFRRQMTELVPHEGVYYRHDDLDVRTQNLHPDERVNGHAHVKSMLLSATSHAIPVVAGEPGFGTWQRLILFEMDEPKDRAITFLVFLRAIVISHPV